MNTEEVKTLKENGFIGFKTIRELKNSCKSVPLKRGVYIVLRPNDMQKDFIEEGTGGHFKHKNPNVTIQELESNWVDGTQILYIGKAGSTTSTATLQSRLEQYMKFGSGKAVGHWGGRLIWQLKDSDNLVVCWKITEKDQKSNESEEQPDEIEKEPRDVEKEMIEQFKEQHDDRRPFANLAD